MEMEQTENLYEESEVDGRNNRKQEAVNGALEVAKKYALMTMPVRNHGINGLVKGTLSQISSLNRPAEKKYLTMIHGKLRQIRSYLDYESSGGEDLLSSIASNLPIYAKRDASGYISNPDHLVDIFGELWDIQRTFGDNSSREPVRRAAEKVALEFRKSGRQGYADILESIVEG